MDLKRARVVLIEDERIMSTYVLGSLRRMGILDLYSFDNGRSALCEISQLKPDLIITDVHMQPMGGIEFVQQLRGLSDEKLSTIPVIFLSADASKTTIGEILPLGVAGYLVKPPNAKALEAKIVHAFKGYNTVIFD
jgi:two-component system chemotaxis response regulator CheY